METEIQNLEKCHEDMKALYQLNTEKLEYNLKVLSEKNDENSKLREELKNKDAMLFSRYRRYETEFKKFDKDAKEKNRVYSKNYKRITRQFKEL